MSSRNASPRLDAGLIARKGEAAPVAPMTAPPEPIAYRSAIEAPALPEPVRDTPGNPIPRGVPGNIAVTVRLDQERYERLKIHGARTRQTNQDMLVLALDLYLGLKQA